MRSGWCPPDVPHAAAHKVCQMRQDDGLLGPCDCSEHGGHVSAQEAHSVREIGAETCDNRDGPEGVSAPESPALAARRSDETNRRLRTV